MLKQKPKCTPLGVPRTEFGKHWFRLLFICVSQQAADWRLTITSWNRANGIGSNTWQPCFWCIWYHSTDSAPFITTSRFSQSKVPPTSCGLTWVISYGNVKFTFGLMAVCRACMTSKRYLNKPSLFNLLHFPHSDKKTFAKVAQLAGWMGSAFCRVQCSSSKRLSVRVWVLTSFIACYCILTATATATAKSAIFTLRVRV